MNSQSNEVQKENIEVENGEGFMNSRSNEPGAAKNVKLRAKWLFYGFLIGVAVSLITVICIYNAGANSASLGEEKIEVDVVTIQHRLDRCAELATATYTYTNADIFSRENVIFDKFDLPGLTGKYFVMKYDGEIKAGINMDEVEINLVDTTVQVSMPQPVVLSHELDEDSFEVIREQDTIFTPFKPDDQNKFRSEQKSAMENKAKEDGLFEDATKNAETSIRAIVESSIPDGYTVEFVNN